MCMSQYVYVSTCVYVSACVYVLHVCTVFVRIEVREFISYGLFLMQRLNETSVYSGPGIYFVNMWGEEIRIVELFVYLFVD